MPWGPAIENSAHPRIVQCGDPRKMTAMGIQLTDAEIPHDRAFHAQRVGERHRARRGWDVTRLREAIPR